MTKVIYFDLGVVFTDFFSGGEDKLASRLALRSQEVLDSYVKTDIAEYAKGSMTDEDRWRLFTNSLGLADSFIPVCID